METPDTGPTVACLACGRSVPVTPGKGGRVAGDVDKARTELTAACQYPATSPCDPEFYGGPDIIPRSGSHHGGRHVRARR